MSLGDMDKQYLRLLFGTKQTNQDAQHVIKNILHRNKNTNQPKEPMIISNKFQTITYYGFKKSLVETFKKKPKVAFILGTGGASSAVEYALNEIKIPYKIVSRNPHLNQIHYEELNKKLLINYSLIINTTPLGTYPDIDRCPKIPYSLLNKTHYLFDLIYNPIKTKFLKLGLKKGAKVQNGHKMLIYQAEKSWELWNKI